MSTDIKEHKVKRTATRTMHGQSNTRLYSIWSGIKNRCFNENEPAFKDYGGRGITVCQEWVDKFTAFEQWALNNGYSESLTIDRINNNGNYEPDNCRWITNQQQSRNRRTNHLLTHKGQTKTLIEWSEELSIPYNTLVNRINVLGWSIEKSLSTPSKHIKRGCGHGRNENL